MKRIMNKWYWIVGFVLASQLAFTMTAFAADVKLCNNCNVLFVRSEDNNEDVVIRLDGDDSQASCTDGIMTSKGSATSRQKDQMVSLALAALLSGKKLTAYGTSSACGSLVYVTLDAN